MRRASASGMAARLGPPGPGRAGLHGRRSWSSTGVYLGRPDAPHGHAMSTSATQVQRTYLLLTLLTTLAASFIWGVNTLFLLDAGLDNTEAFAANAFFSLGHGALRGPDRRGGRHAGPTLLVPAGRGDAAGSRRCCTWPCGRWRRHSSAGPWPRSCSASGSPSSRARPRRGWSTPSRPRVQGQPRDGLRPGPDGRQGRPCSPARCWAASSPSSRTSASPTCCGRDCSGVALLVAFLLHA